MTNFLRMKGPLRGPVITHYAANLPTKSWFSIVEQGAAEHALQNQMANVLLSTAQQFSSTMGAQLALQCMASTARLMPI